MALRYRAVAVIEKAHGNKGKVVAVPRRGLPCILAKDMQVVLVPPQLDMPRSMSVDEVEDSGSGQLVSLSWADDRSKAESLCGKTVLVAEDLLPQDFSQADVDGLIGRAVLDTVSGQTGEIQAVLLGGAQPVWEMSFPDAVAMLPVVDEFVEDASSDPIVVHIPEGLMERGGTA